jgi:HK97 family phage major capsid protein
MPAELSDIQTLMEAQQTAFLKALDDRDAAINARLKAFEDAPALKSSGFISQDGGAQDPEIKNFADFLKAVQRRDHRRLSVVYKTGWQEYGGEAVKALGEGSGPAGGFAVPVTYETEISKIEATIAFFEPLAFQVTMASDTHKFTILKQTGNPSSSGVGASGYFGGMYFTMTAEGGTITDRTPEFEQGTLQARKLTGLSVASSEIREDAPQIERELMLIFAEGIATAKQYLFLHHNGVGGPLGALNAANPARLLVTRKATGNNIEIADAAGLIAKMIPSFAGGSIFITHPFAIEDLMQLSLVTNGDPAFIPASGQAAGSPLLGTLIGKPVYSDEFAALPGSAGDLSLVSPRAYAVGTRSGTLIQGSEHVRFDSDQYTWRVTTRIDGQPRIDGTFKLPDGSNSETSAFCVLN